MKRFSGFTVISGFGWLLDFAILTVLVQFFVPVFWANVTGAFSGVTLVYILAGRHIFECLNPASLWKLLGSYWLWQVVAIAVASALVALLSAAFMTLSTNMTLLGGLQRETISALAAKVLVTPVTLVANFFFMRFLLESLRFR